MRGFLVWALGDLSSFFLYLIMFPQVTLANSQGFGRHEDVEVQEGEDYSMMARSELAWTPPDLPSQHLGMAGASSDASMDGEGEGSPRSASGGHGEPSDRNERSRRSADRFYQLAFIFTLTPSTHTCRLDWAHYWTMHQQIADTIGEDRDSNVQVLPKILKIWRRQQSFQSELEILHTGVPLCIFW